MLSNQNETVLVLTVPNNWFSASRVKQEFVNNFGGTRIFAYAKARPQIVQCATHQKRYPVAASSDVIPTNEPTDESSIGQLRAYTSKLTSATYPSKAERLK
jgi:hypothetical protein